MYDLFQNLFYQFLYLKCDTFCFVCFATTGRCRAAVEGDLSSMYSSRSLLRSPRRKWLSIVYSLNESLDNIINCSLRTDFMFVENFARAHSGLTQGQNVWGYGSTTKMLRTTPL